MRFQGMQTAPAKQVPVMIKPNTQYQAHLQGSIMMCLVQVLIKSQRG